ncbi:MAG: hypothetical protein IKV45_01840 [Firmicutes bacterium]|nr:hypothetical protein [Bacillota bacterium]
MNLRKISGDRNVLSGIALVALLLVFFVVLISGVTAKYTQNTNGENVVVSKEFYFTGNLLSESGSSYMLNTGSKSVTFTLGNNLDKLRFSEDDINYTVTVTCDGTAKTVENGTLEGGKVSVDTITVDDLENGKTYIVTATGTAGYEATLSASFTVADDGKKVYKHLDTTNPAFVLLTVWTENVKGNAVVKVTKAGLIPDNTDAVMASVKNYGTDGYGIFEFNDGASFAGNAYASRTYRFFVNDATGISVDDFDVTVDGQVAANNTP